jgi:hypothetical protein
MLTYSTLTDVALVGGAVLPTHDQSYAAAVAPASPAGAPESEVAGLLLFELQAPNAKAEAARNASLPMLRSLACARRPAK